MRAAWLWKPGADCAATGAARLRCFDFASAASAAIETASTEPRNISVVLRIMYRSWAF
jgi:hypothetical protein